MMTQTPRWLCAVLVVAVALTGPLAVLWMPTPAAAQMSPPPPPVVGDQPGDTEPTEADRVGAGFMNVVFVPGKAILCTVGTAATIGLLLITFGTAHRAARNVFREGCSGDWVLTPEHLSGKTQLRPDVH
jgi:hypothetical protein